MKMFLGLAVLVAVAVAGYFAYATFKPPAAASGPTTAAPVAASASTTAPVVYQIDQKASKARFVIDEILRGNPTTVVGSTNQVAGEIAASLGDIDAARVGQIRINARTLVTDAESRNRMLQNRILQTEQHEFITFTPKDLIGLPDAAAVGQPLTFKMTGDLAIKGTAREVTFDVTMTPTAPNRLEGTASTSIKYADWGVVIPQVPSVAGVDEQVGLHLDFVATSG